MLNFIVKCRNCNLLPLPWSLCPLLSSPQHWKIKNLIICKWTGLVQKHYASTGIMGYLMLHIGMCTHSANKCCVPFLFLGRCALQKRRFSSISAHVAFGLQPPNQNLKTKKCNVNNNKKVCKTVIKLICLLYMSFTVRSYASILL